MYLSKKRQITVGILTIFLMTAAVLTGFFLRESAGLRDGMAAETAASNAAATSYVYDTNTDEEGTLISEDMEMESGKSAGPEAETKGPDESETSIAADTASVEFTKSEDESGWIYETDENRAGWVGENEQAVRLCSVFFPITLILALAGLFFFAVFCKRKQVPEGLETNLLLLALAAGCLYMFFCRSVSYGSYSTSVRSRLSETYYFRGLDVLWAAVLSCMLVWGIRTVTSWFLAKRTLQFSLLWRLTEHMKTQENGVSQMLLMPFFCAVGFMGLSVIFALSMKALQGTANGVSGLMAALSIAFVLLFVLTVFVMFDRLRDVRRIQEEMIRKARMNERYRVDLITNVSHDLRTPLTSIIGYGELLKEEKLSDEGRENLEKLNQKSAYLRDMVDAVFELSKVQSGAMQGRREEIDLIRLLEQTIGQYDDVITKAGLTVVRQYKTAEAPLLSDGIFLNQVFANLLSNAVKYTMKGTRIYVELTKITDGYQVRMMNVACYEMKFDAEEILQRFARGDESRNTEGSGLGLAIAKTYTEAVGGSFRVELDGDLFVAVVQVPEESPEEDMRGNE